MFKNIDEVKKFIEEENIVNVDIRCISDKKVKSITFSASFVFENFNEGYSSIGDIDLLSSFVEVFLAHKTLVFFAVDVYPYSEQDNYKETKYSFLIENDNLDYLASPERDKYRDFVGEISSSLNDIKEPVKCFYADKDNMHSIVLKNDNKYSLEKVKYAILMVAKAYNIKIDETKGIFSK